jgi:hypothetical protein
VLYNGRVRIHGLPAALALLAGCATPKPDSLASAARPADQTAVIKAVAQMARGGPLEDLAAIERELHLDGMLAALKWEELTAFKNDSERWASFTPGPDSPIELLYLHRRQGFAGSFTDTLRLTFKEDRCVSREAAEAAFGKTFEVMMVPYHHPDGSPPRPYTSLTLSGPGGRDVHVAFEREGCEIRLSWPSRPLE